MPVRKLAGRGLVDGAGRTAARASRRCPRKAAMTASNEQRLNLQKSCALLARNEEVIPGGLASMNRRAEPCIAFAKARGSRLWDVDGNEYIDYHAAFAA